MKKIIFPLIVVLSCLFIISPALAAEQYDLTKQTEINNHYDAVVFSWNDQICSAGTYINQIKTSCTTEGQNNWQAVSPLTTAAPEFVSIRKAIVWKDELYYIVDRGLTSYSNNDKKYLEIWRLSNGQWTNVFSYQNNSSYYLSSATNDDKFYLFLYRYDTDPATVFYYISTDGTNWVKQKNHNIPNTISGVTLNGDTLYAYNYSKVFKLKNNKYWQKTYEITNTDTVYTYFNGLASNQGKIYLTLHRYNYEGVGQATDPFARGINSTPQDDGYDIDYQLLISSDGVNWVTKNLPHSTINGAETSLFYAQGDTLYLLAYTTSRKNDLLWKIPKKSANFNGTQDKYLIVKPDVMIGHYYYTRDFIYTANNNIYSSDSHGNIYLSQ